MPSLRLGGLAIMAGSALLVLSACTADSSASTSAQAPERVAALEQQVAELRDQVARLQEELAGMDERGRNVEASLRSELDQALARAADLETQLVREIDTWIEVSDELGYQLQGPGYFWECAPRRSCASQVVGRFQESESDIRAGPIVFAGALDYSRQPAETFDPVEDGTYFGAKVLVQVDGGSEALVVLPSEESGRSSLLWKLREPIESYVRSLEGPTYPLWAGGRAVVFEACGNRPTQYDGGLIVAGAHCVPLDVYTQDESTPERVWIPFGVNSCP